MNVNCQKCGSSRVTYLITPGITACRNDGCGHRQPMTAQAAPSQVTIPAGKDCRHQNQCHTFLHGDCVRSHIPAEAFECVFARAMEDA